MESNIPGYDRYIDREGNVFSTFSGKKLKLRIRYDGYVSFRLNNKGKTALVHRWVAKIYLTPIEGKYEVCHKNNIKTDNRVENLYWGTHQENMRQAWRDGLLKPLKGENSPMYGTKGELAPRSTISNIRRVEIVKLYDEHHNYQKVARLVGMSNSQVRRIIKNRALWLKE